MNYQIKFKILFSSKWLLLKPLPLSNTVKLQCVLLSLIICRISKRIILIKQINYRYLKNNMVQQYQFYMNWLVETNCKRYFLRSQFNTIKFIRNLSNNKFNNLMLITYSSKLINQYLNMKCQFKKLRKNIIITSSKYRIVRTSHLLKK